MGNEAINLYPVTEAAELEQKTPDVIEQAAAFKVTTFEHKEKGIELIRTIKGLRKEVDLTFDEPVKKAHEAHKAMVAAKKKHADPLDQAEKMVKSKITDFDTEQDRIRQVEEARLRDMEAKERQKRTDAAVKKIDGLLAKSANVAEQIKALEAEHAQPGISEEAAGVIEHKLNSLRAKASNLESAVLEKQIEVDQIPFAPRVFAAPVVPKVKGATSTIKKKAEVIDVLALVKAVASGVAPIGIISFDMTALNKLIVAGMTFPGVKVVEERGMSVR